MVETLKVLVDKEVAYRLIHSPVCDLPPSAGRVLSRT